MKNTNQIEKIQPSDAHARGDKVVLLDVRTPVEYAEAHIAGSLAVPLHELDPKRVAGQLPEGRQCCVVCRSGNRATQAMEKLRAAGIEDVVVLDGGVQAWEAAGLPLNRGRKGMSLERQVRIAAGALVVAGVVLALLVHPAFIALSAFVGCGLIFAGLTDWCGMGLLLARMPWNNRNVSCSN